MTEEIKSTFFADQQGFRKWLDKNHKSETNLLVGFYKVSSGKPGMSWPESVDQALCYGWIDGVRKSIDDKSYTIRFTPRKTTSIWSSINIKKVAELTEKGLMQPAGLEIYSKRSEKRSEIYSHENETQTLSKEYLKLFKANKNAWKFFEAQAPSYKKVMLHRIMTAKQEKTRLSRLEKTIQASFEGKRLDQW